MPTLVDTGFLFALANTKDQHHAQVYNLARTFTDVIVLPVTVLPEICYLLDSRLGHAAMREFVTRAHSGVMQIEQLTSSDLNRTKEILDSYADARLDFVDATIVAMAERLQVTRILSIDQRHFRMVRPKHCTAFELLP
jgi:predicted nucleic acid-binding protein